MSIGTRIRQARLAANLSQARLAELLGVTRSACTQWEAVNGTAPRRQRLEQIAELLGVGYEWLATGRASDTEKSASAPLKMTPEIRELLQHFNKLPANVRTALLQLLRSIAA